MYCSVPVVQNENQTKSIPYIVSPPIWEKCTCPNPSKAKYSRSCPVHWTRTIYKLYQSIRRNLPSNANEYSIRLSTRCTTTIDQRQRTWRYLKDRWQDKFDIAYYLSVWHAKANNDHLHLYLATHEPIDPHYVRTTWKDEVWENMTNTIGDDEIAVATCGSRAGLITYMLGINSNHPRRDPPWQEMTGRVYYHSRHKKNGVVF